MILINEAPRPEGDVRAACEMRRSPLRRVWWPVMRLLMTVCRRCGDSEMAPPVSIGTAVKLVAQECQHLGCDLDEMAAALKGGRHPHRRCPAGLVAPCGGEPVAVEEIGLPIGT